MSNSIAVLLIIGSAVVGPIEAQQVQDPTAPYVMRQDFSTGKTESGNLRLESLPELCERAMREIGIDTTNKSGFMSYGYKTDGAKFVYAFGAWSPMKTAQDDWQVRCIPVPTGYRSGSPK